MDPETLDTVRSLVAYADAVNTVRLYGSPSTLKILMDRAELPDRTRINAAIAALERPEAVPVHDDPRVEEWWGRLGNEQGRRLKALEALRAVRLFNRANLDGAWHGTDLPGWAHLDSAKRLDVWSAWLLLEERANTRTRPSVAPRPAQTVAVWWDQMTPSQRHAAIRAVRIGLPDGYPLECNWLRALPIGAVVPDEYAHDWIEQPPKRRSDIRAAYGFAYGHR